MLLAYTHSNPMIKYSRHTALLNCNVNVYPWLRICTSTGLLHLPNMTLNSPVVREQKDEVEFERGKKKYLCRQEQ